MSGISLHRATASDFSVAWQKPKPLCLLDAYQSGGESTEGSDPATIRSSYNIKLHPHNLEEECF
jgi:hypothetical protein